MAHDADGPIRAIRRHLRGKRTADFPEDLNPKLREVLTNAGTEKLYCIVAEH